MDPISTISGIAIPFGQNDVDTDRIIPIRFLRRPLADGYGNFMLRDDRYDADGREVEGCIFNKSNYRGANILIAGRNFGCGSAREGAVYAVKDYGFRTVIAVSFSDIFQMNCCWNGVLPVMLPEDQIVELCEQLRREPGAAMSVDLPAQQVIGPNGRRYPFEIDAALKQRLMSGLDDVGVTQEFQGEIDAFESRYLGEMPWIARITS
jgi:3-isopropylmalate/(R)-2-methylmalate dehydratase small subunit